MNKLLVSSLHAMFLDAEERTQVSGHNFISPVTCAERKRNLFVQEQSFSWRLRLVCFLYTTIYDLKFILHRRITLDFRFFVELFIKQEVPENFQLFLVHGRYTTQGKQASIFPLRGFFSSKQREKLPPSVVTQRTSLLHREERPWRRNHSPRSVGRRVTAHPTPNGGSADWMVIWTDGHTLETLNWKKKRKDPACDRDVCVPTHLG